MKPGKPLQRKTSLKRGKKPERVPKGATTIERLLGDKKVFRASSFTAKPRPMKKRAKTTGPTQIEFFLELWSERPHFSEVGGEFLGEEMQPIYMSHLLPKGAYRRFKFRKDNIVLMTPNEHQLWHSEGPNNLQSIDRWKPICEKYYQLRDEAHGVA